MLNNGIIAIWAQSNDEFKNDFISSFNELSENKRDNTGIVTYVMCEYRNSSIYAEVIYTIILNDVVYFLLDTTQYELSLDSKFVVNSFHTNDDCAYIFVSSLFETGNVEYISECCSDIGTVYRVFSLNKPSQITAVTQSIIPIDMIDLIDDEFVMQICADYMQYKTDTFTKQILIAIANDEPYEGIEENPFQDKFFDRYENMNIEEPHEL